MGKKVFKKLCLGAISLVLTLSCLTSCMGTNNTPESDPSSGKQDDTPKVETNSSVWSTYSTVKVTQNQKIEEQRYYTELAAEVNIEMMKDETEGTQLIVTAGKDIKNYDLIVSDLSDGKGNTLPKENIYVYHQKYMLATGDYDSDGYLNVGDYIPDMLLPLDIAKQYGENKIKAGENQGITIEAQTDKNTVAGVYTGSFTLDLDGDKRNIPVSVTVWDIVYDAERSEYQSSFLIYKNELMYGEYDASDEKVSKYVEFLMKYNANGNGTARDGFTAEQLVEELDGLWGNKNFNSVRIPVAPAGNYSANSSTAEEIITFIVDMVKYSTPEKPWVELLYCYPVNYDEVTPSSTTQWNYFLNTFKKGGPWDVTRERALERAKETEEYQAFDDDFKARVDKAILTLPAVLPTGLPKDGNGGHEILADLNVVLCPVINVYNDDRVAEQAVDYAATSTDGKLWVYSCINPTYPYPTFHTTDRNLGNRIAGWHSKKWNINGYLYFMTNMYECLASDSYKFCDPYETDVRQWCPGDGYLLYPGRKYGSEYPFASMRLVAYRDSVDDYDMLTVYEHLLNEKAKKYGIEINFNDYVEDLYDTLFDGTQYYTDDSLVLTVRRELANRIMAVKSDLGLVISQKNGVATVYCERNSLRVDGELKGCASSGEGYVLTITNTWDKARTFSIGADGELFNYTVYSGKDITFNQATANSTSSISVNGSYAEVTLRSEKKANDGQTIRFKPYIELSLSDISNASNIQFEMDNVGDTEIETEVYIILEDGSQLQLGAIYIESQGERSVRLNFDRRKFTDEVLAKAKKLRFTFENVLGDGTATLLPDKSFIIDNVFIELNK